LNIIAQDPSKRGEGEVVLTPHPAEAARLLGCTTLDVTRDPLTSAASIASAYRATVLLKGAETVVSDPDGVCTIVHEGDSTLSTAGTGDVLAGLVASYIAQGVSLPDAAMLGAFVHGRAGKLLGSHSAQRGVTASQVATKIPDVVSQLQLVWNS